MSWVITHMLQGLHSHKLLIGPQHIILTLLDAYIQVITVIKSRETQLPHTSSEADLGHLHMVTICKLLSSVPSSACPVTGKCSIGFVATG